MNGRELIEHIAGVLERMPVTTDKKWRITAWTELWICPQVEQTVHNKRHLTWWVRWVDNSGIPIESHYCEHPLLVVVAITVILEKAGVSTK